MQNVALADAEMQGSIDKQIDNLIIRKMALDHTKKHDALMEDLITHLNKNKHLFS